MPKEGELYEAVSVFGKTFEIYYGYYEDFERNSIYNDPVPIYPDLIKNPEYGTDGRRIVTEMQIACEDYSGSADDDSCAKCVHFTKGEKLFGLCDFSKESGTEDNRRK